jgi:hypothetical protein
MTASDGAEEPIGSAGGMAVRYADALQNRHETLPRETGRHAIVHRSAERDRPEEELQAEENQAGGLQHPDEAPQRPEMTLARFAMPLSSQTGSEQSQSASEEGSAGGEAAPPGSGSGAGPGAKAARKPADARAVADRVYELMKQEVILARQRGVRER